MNCMNSTEILSIIRHYDKEALIYWKKVFYNWYSDHARTFSFENNFSRDLSTVNSLFSKFTLTWSERFENAEE